MVVTGVFILSKQDNGFAMAANPIKGREEEHGMVTIEKCWYLNCKKEATHYIQAGPNPYTGKWCNEHWQEKTKEFYGEGGE